MSSIRFSSFERENDVSTQIKLRSENGDHCHVSLAHCYCSTILGQECTCKYFKGSTVRHDKLSIKPNIK